jgi:hypothetical protein
VTEDSAIRVQNLPTAPYFLFMLLLSACRFAVCWLNFVLFLGSFAALVDQVKEISVQFEPRALAAISFLAVTSIAASAAWWTTLCKMRSHRIWVTVVSMLYLLTVAYLFFAIPSFLHSQPMIWLPVVVGALGLVAYLPPFRLRISMDVSSYRVKCAEQRREEFHISI